MNDQETQGNPGFTAGPTDSISSTGSMNNTGTTVTGPSGTCPTCGQSTNRSLEQLLGRLGITDEMINNLKTSFQNVDVDDYLNTARDYLKNTGDKATTFTKENPGKVAAGVAVLAVGAGLLINSLTRGRGNS